MTASTEHGPKHPGVVVDLGDLHGPGGNSFVVVARVIAALAQAKVSWEEGEQFRQEAMSGDRRHLMQTVLDWVTVVGDVSVDD
jgi:hypothetical protein